MSQTLTNVTPFGRQVSHMPLFHRPLLILLTLLLLSSGTGPLWAAPTPPELIFAGPQGLEGELERLRRIDPAELIPMMEMMGLEEPGPPIHIWLAPEGSEEARRAPSWSVAYAFGAAGTIVLMPSRVPAYPDHHLEGVLRHEIAHVFVARAAGRRPVPRWFNEGLATLAAREWQLEDSGRLMWANLHRGTLDLQDLDQRFRGGRHSAGSAYALSTAFVRYLLAEHGDDAAARILRRVAAGDSFPTAVRTSLGVGLTVVTERYASHLNLWHKWLPLLGSSTTLWILISGLALLAFRRRQVKSQAMYDAWDEEDARRALLEQPTDGWVH